MRCIRVERFGDSAELQLVDAVDPIAAPGEVVVAVEAAGVNHADLARRAGTYVGGPRPPFVPGVEGAGTVIARGDGVERPAIGDRVAFLAKDGAYAERIAVPAAACVAWSGAARDGAAFLVSHLTAYHALVTVGHAQPGEVVLVHAGAGALGTAAIQIAKLLGLRVVATASTDAKRALVRALGADVVTDYDGFEDAARGAALALESVGGDVLRRTIACLAPLGRAIVVGCSSGEARPLDPLKLLFTSRAALGFHLDAIVARRDLLEPSLAWLRDRVATGELAIRAGDALPLADAARAHDRIAARATTGKVVLLP